MKIEPKTDLTPQDKIIAAYLVDVRGVTQEIVAIALNVSNPGRVNEALMTVRKAIGLRDDAGYKDKPAPVRVEPPHSPSGWPGTDQ